MQQYTVLLFGPAAEAIGKGRVMIQAPEMSRCEELKALIVREFPALDDHLQAGRLAVNQSFVAGDTPIDPRDEIALITMVSGG